MRIVIPLVNIEQNQEYDFLLVQKLADAISFLPNIEETFSELLN